MSKRLGLSALLLGCGITLLALVAVGPTTALAEEMPLAPAVNPEAAAPCEVPLAQLLASDVVTPSVDPLFNAVEEVSPFLRRYCRCSCGFPCQSDADCGGGVCRTGITCC